MTEPVRPPSWHRDPIVGLFVLVGATAMAVVLFAGRYLPYQDWAGHVGLSAVLAMGHETGADAYLVRSFAPTPYFTFYVCTALLGRIIPIEVAAKLNLVIATVVAVTGAARLAQATGRSPRLSGLAALMMFGVSLGLGFASFVTGLPWLLHALAETERLMADPARRWSSAGRLTIFLALCFLGHGLVFVFAALLIGARCVQHLSRPPRSWSPVGFAFAAGGIVVLTLGMPAILRRIERRYVSPEFVRPGGPAPAGWASVEDHLRTFAGDMLDRGGDGHEWTMIGALLWGVSVSVAVRWWGRHAAPRPSGAGDGLMVYAATASAIFLLGPVWIGWPVTFWVVYQRAGTVAALFWLMMPRTALHSRSGAILATASVAVVAHNAAVNAAVVAKYSEQVRAYDDVRAAVPPGHRILPLSRAPRPQDTLGFYHLVDGAAYVPVGNVPEEMPVHRSNRSGTPYNPSWDGFDPRSHGRMYDYLVVHGDHPRLPSPIHEATVTYGPWTIFRTRSPLPPSAIRW